MKLSVIMIALPALLSLNSWALAKPASAWLPNLAVRIERVLIPHVEDIEAKMQNEYPVVLDVPPIDLGLHVITPKPCSDMKKPERLTTLYRQLKRFDGPVTLVASSMNATSAPKELHNSVIDTLLSLRVVIDATVEYMKLENISIPTTVKMITGTQMTSATIAYLTKLNVQIPLDMMTIYRNYFVIYALHDALQRSVRNCIPYK